MTIKQQGGIFGRNPTFNDVTVTGAFTSLGIDDNATSTAITIDASENVGIGTATPSAKLSVAGLAMSSASAGVELEGTWPWLKFKDTEASQDSWLQYVDGSSFIIKQIGYADRNAAPSTVGTERMAIDGGGRVIIPAGVTLGTAAGVYSAANTLDDYEEGTWTPNFSAWTTTPATYGTWARYTKIGRVVSIQLRGYGGTNTAGISITGLPFTPYENPYGTGLAVGSAGQAGFQGTFTAAGLAISSNAAPYWWGFSGTYTVA